VSPAALDKEGRVVTVFGLSKAYAMTGWRLGYAVAPEPIARTIQMLQEPLVSCASAVLKKTAEAALPGPQSVVREMHDIYRHGRDAVLEVLQDIGCYESSPKGAFHLQCFFAWQRFLLCRQSLTGGNRGGDSIRSCVGSVTRDYVRISLASGLGDLLERPRRTCEFVYGH